MKFIPFLLTMLLAPTLARAADPAAPTTVETLFADFDPRRDPLDIRIIRQWEKEGITYRYVTFLVGTFKGEAARMAGFYAFPHRAHGEPGLLHLHGGGQRAFLHEVEFYAKRGYPCLSINWGGREMEEARAEDPNTDWGAVDPTQQNVPGYFNLLPGPQYVDPFDSPRNNNWYLLTLAARRALTFLEQQPEVDPERLGVYGHSMGGNLTVYVAGSDARVKAAAPSVGGSGFRTQPWPLLPEHKPQHPNGDVALFDATLGFESYAPRITAPLLWLGATNDFHGIMDDTYRTGMRIPHQNVRYAFTPHLNHRFTPEFAVTRPLWFDQHLRSTFTFPKTPDTRLVLSTEDHVPVLVVKPDPLHPINQVAIYYSIDPDPRARFWRSADVLESEAGQWMGKLPIMRIDAPLFAFANVEYAMAETEAEPHARRTQSFAISSMLHTITPDELSRHGVRATDKHDRVIEDFTHDWRDWYRLSPDNPHHWEYSTRKLTDPKWRGASADQLGLQVRAAEANDLLVVLTTNFFRQYRGPQKEFVAVVKLRGNNEIESFGLRPSDFRSNDDELLDGWEGIDILSFRAYYEKGTQLIGSKQWKGSQPTFLKLSWQP